MTISIEEVNYISKLSKLKFSQEEAEELSNQFSSILMHFDSLNNEDLSDVKISTEGIGKSVRREDKVVEYISDKEELFGNARKMRDKYIEIPKVIE